MKAWIVMSLSQTNLWLIRLWIILPALFNPSFVHANENIGFRVLDSSTSVAVLRDTIQSLCASNGGTLNLGPGTFHLSAPIIIPCAIKIIGSGWREQPQEMNAGFEGTWLSIEQSEAPAFSFVTGSKGASLADVAFVEPNQIFKSPVPKDWHPVPMPPAIFIRDVGGFTYLHNIYMHGVDRGVESRNGGRTTIDGLYGQFFKNAITLDKEMDISRISNVHSWPYFSEDSVIISYQQHHLDTLILGHTDGAFIDGIFAYAARSGITFPKGSERNVATGIQIGRLECDSVQHCLRVNAAGVTIMIDQMRQFGQEGTASGHPLPDANAISITGQASILLSQVEARMIDNSLISDTNPAQCSNIRISEAFVDFTHSRSSEHDLIRSLPCGPHDEAHEIIFGMLPAVIK